MSSARRDYWREVSELREQLAGLKASAAAVMPPFEHIPSPEDEAILQGGGGGGTSGGGGPMDERVIRLESDVGRLKDDLAELKSDFRLLRTDVGTLKIDVATLKENVRHLPGKGFIVTAAGAIVALLTAAITFADKLHSLAAG